MASDVIRKPEYQEVLRRVSTRVKPNHALKAFPVEFRERVKRGEASQDEIDSAVSYARMEISDFVYFKPDIFIGAPSQRKYIAVARDAGIKQTAAFIASPLDLEGKVTSFYRSTDGTIVLNKDSPLAIERKLANAAENSIADLKNRLNLGDKTLATYLIGISGLFVDQTPLTLYNSMLGFS
jgi:tyrosyl-tRNA synthetase